MNIFAGPVYPTSVRHIVDLFYRGNCNDPQVQIFIKKLFLRHITQSVEHSSLCNKPGKCGIKDISVKCGRTIAFERRKRSIWHHAENEQLEVEFEITINADEEVKFFGIFIVSLM